MKREKEFLSVKEFAKIIRLSPLTVKRWIGRGEIKAIRLGKTGHYRIAREELEKITK